MSDVTQIEAIYMAAAERTDPAERAAYLDAACGADVDLRRRVDELLAAHPKLGRFLEPPSGATDAFDGTGDGVPIAVGRLIDGRYKLLERIGEGGMGEVWVADQLAPVRRRVAVKLIKPGMDSRGVLARFEAERQALAIMNHPNIAKVLDAGTSADGRPYFVMELVKGTPITELADARRLTPAERLALFVPVCQAIQHAHQKGVIHRDIKPSNVLVELHDDRLVPKVIDFGVAKAVGAALTEKTIYTGLGTLVGTPAYMAPEQATFNALDIDTRADVYALGVLLYELLAGSPPVEAERLKKAAFDEVLRLIREEEPPRPSQRLSTSQTKASIAAVRGSDPAKLSALMRGELDWIVMKALEKDRGRRYDTATALAKDVQRYINGDAVEACPPTFGYRLRKAYRRNRAAVLVGSAFAVLLMIGLAAASVLAVQARRAEAVAEDKRIEAEEQAERADEQAQEAAYFSGLASGTAKALRRELHQVQFLKADIQIELYLREYQSDRKVGLLRFIQTLESIPKEKADDPDAVLSAKKKALREYITAAVISAGQEFVPLVPPLDFENARENAERLSPDFRRYIGGDERHGLELRTLPDSTRIGMLREGTERVVRFGFSPDGQTAFTQDTDSVVRFWNTDGTFRAKTPLRPERYVYPAGMRIDTVRNAVKKVNTLIVADGVAALLGGFERISCTKEGEVEGLNPPERPTDLYSTRTGQFIRRINPGRWGFSGVKLEAGGRWLIYQEHKERVIELVILSADDGRELARLNHNVSNNSPFGGVEYSVSPTRQWLMAWQQHQPKPGADWEIDLRTFQLWRCHDWKPVQDTALADVIATDKRKQSIVFLTDDMLVLWVFDAPLVGVHRIGQPGSWTPRAAFEQDASVLDFPIAELGGKIFRDGRTLFTADPIKRLNLPSGRKYHPDLAKIAPDGRFFENLDTVTEKDLPAWFAPVPVPGLGRVSLWNHDHEGGNVVYTALHIYPNADRLDIPPPMLQLWAQVVAGGELVPDGRFQPWDQPTWAAKRRELAAMKPPYPDFPFPGLAADPNAWHLVRVKQLRHSPERDRHLEEWQRLTGRHRPKPEPDTWRTPGPAKSGPTTEPASPPRAVK